MIESASIFNKIYKSFLRDLFLRKLLALTMLVVASSFDALSQDTPSHVGNYYLFLHAHSKGNNSALSFLQKEWDSVEVWRAEAREKLEEMLAFKPQSLPLNTIFLDTIKRQGYTQYLVKYNLNSLQETEAFLLIPDNLQAPAPAVIALHDHGGFYYFGKEKHTSIEDSPQILKDYIHNLYEGRPYADELAKRGFIVLCPDAMYFGSQKIDPTKLPKEVIKDYFLNFSSDGDERIRSFNKLASQHEVPVEKTILTAGTTWLGIIARGDRVAIDFLLSRPEVDPEKIACIGLSLGGLRSTYLFGLDSRIKVGVVTCFSTTYEHMLKEHVKHTWMMYVPGQYQYLDLPDVASLNAPRPLLIQNANQDHLFNIEGMKAASYKLSQIYQKMNETDKFKTIYYEKPHSMDIQMQEDAFEWLERWLF